MLFLTVICLCSYAQSLTRFQRTRLYRCLICPLASRKCRLASCCWTVLPDIMPAGNFIQKQPAMRGLSLRFSIILTGAGRMPANWWTTRRSYRCPAHVNRCIFWVSLWLAQKPMRWRWSPTRFIMPGGPVRWPVARKFSSSIAGPIIIFCPILPRLMMMFWPVPPFYIYATRPIHMAA